MKTFKPKSYQPLFDQAVIWIPFFVGLWFVVVRPLGPHLSLLPGDLGDTRFNNYLLEHFFRWIQGLDKNYWNATFFYPFANTIAFSDNLLGTAPFYALFRATGLDRETAFQAWYILGFLFNYGACVYVLRRLKFTPPSVVVAGFFFTFGLPLLAQETHAQLLYRFGVPLSCGLLWLFFQEPDLKKLIGLAFWSVWQFYAGVYIGVFLAMLLVVMALLLPFFSTRPAVQNPKAPWPGHARQLIGAWISAWPVRLKQAWDKSSHPGRLAALVILAGLAASLAMLLGPYYSVTRMYGFSRNWNEVLTLLPKPRSYLIADRSLVWRDASNLIANFNGRIEHQLFPGGAILLILLGGVFFHHQGPQRRLAFFSLCAAVILLGATLAIRRFSLYHFLWYLPGMKSIRAVTRIELVFMWPLGVFAAYVIDSLLQQKRLWRIILVCLAFGLMLCESALFNHYTTSKADAQTRLITLLGQVARVALPADPIIAVAQQPGDPFYFPEIDAMQVAQNLNWPTLNGYSGNFPPGFQPANSCKWVPDQIKAYLDFTHQLNNASYLALIKRVVPIGFTDCDPGWWTKMPN